jgi:probable rRNA maturation factor
VRVSVAESDRSPPRPLDLNITATAGQSLVPYLRRHLPCAHRLVKSSLKELSVALVGDAKMSELHERFMSLAGPTDVLSFPLEHDGRGRCVAGEVVVCVPEARRRARERQLPVRNEVLLYAIHGMLHLIGFDDRTQADYRKMHRTEDRILTELGIGATFHSDERRTTRRGAGQPRVAARRRRTTARGK